MHTNSDYRNADKCPSLEGIKDKKEKLKDLVIKEHRRTKIIYNQIKNKDKKYFDMFAKIYNYKCAYCGTSLKFTDGRLFEIDHFICESAYTKDTAGRAEAGKIGNLSFSCYSCNRGKGSLHIKDSYVNKLNPDDNSISKVFYREQNFYIKKSSKFTDDEFVSKFYDELLFGSEFRRLDYLLLEVDDFIQDVKEKDEDFARRLQEIKSKLQEKKNGTFIKQGGN
ncbi:5-methylcytosine-specific restriction endonuclease McrA [Lachnospiraceae bacterium PF1-21]|uniref:HNH domain-containing protein n=1 Tax=Ohessyouella blattaphilus TaxID=2949333 RepID=A0ABT1EM45_9FIRM|nr:HNH endonuclease [Ohessyouella blattaphilus]MCP1110877.1 hypothetical protein [Ohessyouella blattaphilus]MCR8564271.1 hypothetical protein [Ohessyouella blattaphilus]